MTTEEAGGNLLVDATVWKAALERSRMLEAALAAATARAKRAERERDRLRAVVQEIATVKRLGASMTEAVYGHRAQQYAAANLDAPATGEAPATPADEEPTGEFRPAGGSNS